MGLRKKRLNDSRGAGDKFSQFKVQVAIAWTQKLYTTQKPECRIELYLLYWNEQDQWQD